MNRRPSASGSMPQRWNPTSTLISTSSVRPARCIASDHPRRTASRSTMIEIDCQTIEVHEEFLLKRDLRVLLYRFVFSWFRLVTRTGRGISRARYRSQEKSARHSPRRGGACLFFKQKTAYEI